MTAGGGFPKDRGQGGQGIVLVKEAHRAGGQAIQIVAAGHHRTHEREHPPDAVEELDAVHSVEAQMPIHEEHAGRPLRQLLECGIRVRVSLQHAEVRGEIDA